MALRLELLIMKCGAEAAASGEFGVLLPNTTTLMPKRHLPRQSLQLFLPIVFIGSFVLPLMIGGINDALAIRRLAMPYARKRATIVETTSKSKRQLPAE